MSVLTTLPNVIRALSSRALGKKDAFDVRVCCCCCCDMILPWKGSLTSDSLSKESGQWRGGGSSQGRGQSWSRMCPPSGLEDGLTGYRKDTASPESSTSSASQEA